MKKQLSDYLHFYLGCDVKSRDMGTIHPFTVINEKTYKLLENGDFVLLLRPLSDMTKEECLEVCKLASPTAWGDYRFKKWIATPDPKNSDSWKAYDVTNENSNYSFVVDLIDGDITLWDEGDYENTLVNQNYRFWYLSKGFDLFNLIPEGIAIDKTKI